MVWAGGSAAEKRKKAHVDTTNCLTNQKYFICGVFVVYNFERVVLGKNITLYGKNNTLSEKKISTVRTVSSEIPGRTGGPVVVWSSSGKCVEEFGRNGMEHGISRNSVDTRTLDTVTRLAYVPMGRFLHPCVQHLSQMPA